MNIEQFVTPWARESSRSYDSWHSMCSYLGSFPAPLASYFIKHFSNTGDVVLDPFSGRGTTLLEARLLDRKSVATDLNPIALALSEAKNVNFTKHEIFERIEHLELSFDPALYLPEALAQPDEIHLIFHPRTLAQLCYLKRKFLKSKLPVDKYLIGCVLGVMHGGERKDGTSGYLSISMPNTFSMSPDYVRRFVQTNQLNTDFRDVFKIIRDKTDRLFDKHSLLKQQGVVVKADAKTLSKNEEIKQYLGKVNLIITSPPYLGIVNYAKQNWIRSWLLDKDTLEVSNELDDDLNLTEWVAFSTKVIKELKALMREDGVAIFVIGDVAKSKTSVIPLAREFCSMVKEANLFKNIWCISDVIDSADKTTRIWGESKGSATAIDRIVILSDINPFEKFKTDGSFETLGYDFVLESTKSFIR